MKAFYASSLTALSIALAMPAAAQTTDAAAPAPAPAEQADDNAVQVGEVIVTAQRRTTDLQDTSAAITAIGGAQLEKDRVLSFEDVAGRVTSMSFTALSPLDQEFNIRGITNTRLDSPTADQSIGIFFDDVYVGRSGLFNFDLYDIDRVEVVRGPQGVLLGRNVVGGALSIYSATPKSVYGGHLTASYGNYNEKLVNGHVTGPISDSVSGRFAFQVRQRDGFARDVAHNVDLDNVDSVQMRGSLQWRPEGGNDMARLTMDYTKDKSNGFHTLMVDGPLAGSGPWSTARNLVGIARGKPLGIRESIPDWNTYKGDVAPTPQELDRRAFGVTLQMEHEFEGFATLTSITGYRDGKAYSQYDQTGIGPSNAFGVAVPLLFRSPVRETEKIKQYTQEIRLVSPEQTEQGFDWIVGAYAQRDKVQKFDTISFEIANPNIPTLSGESAWVNRGKNLSYAFFGQVGYRFSPQFRVVGGLRYSHDQKSGVVSGLSVETGDRFRPNDPVASSPLSSIYPEGGGYTTGYGNTWSQVTPQITGEFKATKDILFYATYSTGYKGGGCSIAARA